MILKYMRDVRSIINRIKNGGWALQQGDSTDLDIFLKYKDNAKLFIKVGDVWKVYFELATIQIQGGLIIEPDILVALYQYLFVMGLDNMLSIHGVPTTHKEANLVSSIDDEPTTGYADKMLSQLGNTEEDIELSFDSEFEDDNSTGTEQQATPGYAAKLIKTQRTQHEILVDFIKDVMAYIRNLETVYNDMNIKRIAEENAKTIERQKRQNLNAFKFLGRDGMEADYRMVINKIAMGALDYSKLNEYINEYFSEEYIDWDNDENITTKRDGYSDMAGDLEQEEEQARRNKLGLDDHEMEEMGFVGAAEDMEDQDYGYMAVDED
jgi:hypothetical protein